VDEGAEVAKQSGGVEDIEAAVQAELDDMKKQSEKPKQEHAFLPVKSGLDCVFFVKTRNPVDPVDFALRFCQDAETYTDRTDRPLKHINKLSPVVSMGSSLNDGLERMARRTLGTVFQLKPEKDHEPNESPADSEDGGSTMACSVRLPRRSTN
jgi:tRNA acetyltransferase TAN1